MASRIIEPIGQYPDDNPKTTQGVKKPSLSKVPPAALAYMALAMMDGADKYGPFNWRDRKVTSSIYVDATMRHLLAWWDGEQNAKDSGYPHLAHALACLAIIVDALETGNLNDDRPRPGAFSDIIERYTRGK